MRKNGQTNVMVKFLPPPPRDSRRRGQKKKNPFSTYDVYFPIMGASRTTSRSRGATTAEKLRRPRFGFHRSNTGRLRSAPGHRPGCRCVREGGAPSRCGDPGYQPREIFFENSNAKSCILVTTTLISGLPRTCISQQTTSMSRAKSVPKFQLSAEVALLVVRTKNNQWNL